MQRVQGLRLPSSLTWAPWALLLQGRALLHLQIEVDTRIVRDLSDGGPPSASRGGYSLSVSVRFSSHLVIARINAKATKLRTTTCTTCR
jgi:hypothetical protein